jgi:hypothetical protein
VNASDDVPNLAGWSALVRRAVVGTRGASEPLELALSADAPGEDDPLRATLRDAERDDLAFARAAGAFSILRRAAARAPRTSASASVAAPSESAPRARAEANADLAFALAASERPIVEEWLECAMRANVRVAEELLPKLLDFGAAHRAARANVLAVAGARGRWLAAREPAWSFVIGDAPFAEAWAFGDHAARVVALGSERSRDPASALAALETAWPSENAKTRAEFLPLLRVGLSDADEPFLERALDDGNKLVRAAAAALLGALPRSRFATRSIASAEAHVSLVRVMLRQELRVTLPETFTPAMKRDGMTEAAPSGTGQKAWWLQQIVERVPPSHWSNALARKPHDVLALAASNEFAHALLSGIATATANARDATWASAFLDGATEPAILAHALVANRPLGATPERARSLAAMFDRRQAGSAILATTYPGTWNDELTRSALRFARWMLDQSSYDWRMELETLLGALAERIDPLVPEAGTIWPEEFAHQYDARSVSRFCRTIVTRARVRAHLMGNLA